MTIRITVRNEDADAERFIQVKDESNAAGENQKISGGQAQEFFLHKGMTLTISEPECELEAPAVEDGNKESGETTPAE